MVVMFLHPKCAKCLSINGCFAMHGKDGTEVVEPDSHTCLMIRGERCCEALDAKQKKKQKKKRRGK